MCRSLTPLHLVVGGGTAGNVVAARLAEDPETSVVVVEAGGFYEVSSIPENALARPFTSSASFQVADGWPARMRGSQRRPVPWSAADS